MGLRGIPIVGIGPGSQPLEEDGATLDYIAMPQGMNVYARPMIPEPEQVQHLSEAVELVHWVRDALGRYRAGDDPIVADVSGLDRHNRVLLNQILGEGEVAVRYSGDFRARVQESVLAGVWRTFYLDDEGRPVRDLVEIADVPVLAKLGAKPKRAAPPRDPSSLEVPAQVMNALPLLTELQERSRQLRPGDTGHVVNLTLLPLSPEDRAFLDTALGRGPVSILSRGYGDCRIADSDYPYVWSVRYYNSTGSLILDTLEVVETPAVVAAAAEDIADSARRLDEIIELYDPPPAGTGSAADG